MEDPQPSVAPIVEDQSKQESEVEYVEEEIEVEEEVEEEVEVEVEEEEDEGVVDGEERLKGVEKEKWRPRDYEVFVGGLDRDSTEDDLVEALGRVGKVDEVRLVRERSGRSRGFAFVKFATVEQARRAIKELRTVKVNGKLCGVMKSNDNVTLHLGNICKSWTKEMLEEKLKSLGLEKIEEVHLMNDPNMKGMNRGYAFLDFRSHMDAVAGCIKLQRQDAFFGTDARAVVSFSMSACEPDEEVMAQVKSVFLDRLPGTWDEDKVHEECKKFGEIRSIQLACNMPTAKRNDFCFVYFETREAALECIEKVNKDGLGNGSQKILVKASLKKPLPKWSSQMMNSRRGYTGDHSGGRRLREYETESTL
ncbi:Polyadenylate-binding protein 5 [Acorus calamus]|uniref:Polyadenylate-binding protein 5 n=2 Tax=Acorus calamus TaxID=4465 RepID=A0AAV9DU54_ACOCL|nr:Polyadenylate-binding protein 5 [Acorus calamus]